MKRLLFIVLAIVVFAGFKIVMSMTSFMEEEKNMGRSAVVADLYNEVRQGDVYAELQQTLSGMTVMDQANYGEVAIVADSMTNIDLTAMTPDQAGAAKIRSADEKMTARKKDNVLAWMAWLDNHMYNSDQPEPLLLQKYIIVSEMMLFDFIKDDFGGDAEQLQSWEELPVIAWLYYGIVMTLDNNRCNGNMDKFDRLYEAFQRTPQARTLQTRWLSYDDVKKQALMNKAMGLDSRYKERLPSPYFCGQNGFAYKAADRAGLVKDKMRVSDSDWHALREQVRSSFQRSVMINNG